jgi:hypothetical protein
MADESASESRWDRLRVRLISIGLLVAFVLFLFRADEWIRAALPNSDPSAMLAWFIPAAMTLTGAGFMMRTAWQVRRWPRVPGVILSASLKHSRAADEEAESFQPLVRYSYTVDGVKREGRRLALRGTDAGGSESWAREVLARYPVGKPISVFYNPANPDEAAIEASAPPLARGLLVLGCLLMLGVVYAAGVF